MAQAIDIGPAVLLQKRLAQASLASGAAIYLEGIVTLVLLSEGMLSPLAVAPIFALQAAQFFFVRKPARLLAAETSTSNDRPGSALARAYRLHLLLAAAFVGLVWVGASNAHARPLAPVLGVFVIALTVWPVVQMMRAARSVHSAFGAVRDPGVILDCFSFDVRAALALRLQSAGGQRMRWGGPLLAATVALVATALPLAIAVEALGIANGPVGPVSAVVAAAVYYRSARRAKLRASELRATDTRPPVLILRQFRDDMLGAGRFSLGASPTFEHAVAAALMRIGPTISVGRPGECLQPLGAAREYLTDPDWQRAVEKLIREAAVVVCVLGDSENLLWEFRTAISARGTAGALVLVPPLGDAAAVRQRWERFAAATADIVGDLGRLPAQRVLAICFAGSEPILIVTSERAGRRAMLYRTDPDYRLALRLFEHLHRDALRSLETLEAWVAERIPIVAVAPVRV